MGGSIIPVLVEAGEAHVYDFADNHVPGATDRDRGYWRDVGTLDSYYDAHMDLVSVHPIFNLYNREWPIYTPIPQLPPAKFVLRGRRAGTGQALDSIVSAGAIISGGTVRRSVISPGVLVDSGAAGRGLGAHARRGDRRRARSSASAIIDKNVAVPPGAPIGVDPSRDGQPLHRVGQRRRRHRQGQKVPMQSRQARRCGRPADPRVPARGLRRRRRPRRVPGQELAPLVDVDVYCFGAPATSPLVAGAYEPWDASPAGRRRRRAASHVRRPARWRPVEGVDLVHSHTWYANFGGHLARLLYGIPHVLTAHSLEPLRPWKAEQLGGGLRRVVVLRADGHGVGRRRHRGVRGDEATTSWPPIRRSTPPRRVIHNGIDPDEYTARPRYDVLPR